MPSSTPSANVPASAGILPSNTSIDHSVNASADLPQAAKITSLRPLGLEPSFGFGDRLGLATVGHVEALRAAGGEIRPIFAQQSIREMKRTHRTPAQVMADANRGVERAGYRGVTGADADHLKTTADVDQTAAAGFVFFTIDPSEHVDGQADSYAPAQLAETFKEARQHALWAEEYRHRTVQLPNGTPLELTQWVLQKAAVKYGRAIEHAIMLARHIDSVHRAKGRAYEIELSVDETPQPTTIAEHYIIADQCLRNGVRLVSLAPRFVGEFEKGVDYKGSIEAFKKSAGDHAAVAELLGASIGSKKGGYKLSLHSGSDKLSIYPALSRATRGRFHVKTAGTSYLEALRVVAREESGLFREVIDFARGRYDADKATYHVSATLAGVPAPSPAMSARDLERLYLGLWDEVPPGAGLTAPGRQILHCTFGSVLNEQKLGPEIRDILQRHEALYTELLKDHFLRHLRALRESR